MQRVGGGSSGRRVVRSALETLMDTATPELPGRSGNNSSADTETPADVRLADLASNRRSSAMTGGGPSASPFSVTYTTAVSRPTSTRHENTLKTNSATEAIAHTRPNTTTSSSSSRHAKPSSSAASAQLDRDADAPPRLSTITHVRKEEPSALAFLSPQGKAARPSSSDRLPVSPSDTSRSWRQSTSLSAPRHHPPHASNEGNGGGFSNTQPADESPAQKKHAPRKRPNDHDARHPFSSSSSLLFAAPAPAPASPSRSLYSDVEAARQQQQQLQSSNNDDAYANSSSCAAAAAADTSFLEDTHSASDGDADDDDGDSMRADTDVGRAARLRGSAADDAPASPAAALVPASAVNARISAALRRYEKARDAEEEAVLQQVSAEVEAQAARYTALVEAHNSVCSDNTQLQEQLDASTKTVRALEEALQHARQTQQAQRETMKRLEVELYHARDAQQDAQAQQRAQLESEAAEWATTRRRYEKRHATLEAQLTQLREELRDKDAQLADLRRAAEKAEGEVSALRQRSAERETAVEAEYAEIHQRMLRLGQNMSTMESTLQQRDEAIEQLRAQLSEASHVSHNRRCELSQWEKEKAALESALANTRDLLERQTNDVRKRMHRLAVMEQQKNTLKSEVSEARQALSTSANEQARVLALLEGLMEDVARLSSPGRSSAFRKPTRPQQGTGTLKSRSHKGRDANGEASVAALRVTAPHPDDTLVYEDDSADDAGHAMTMSSGSDYSSASDAHTAISLASSGDEGESEEEQEEEGVAADNGPPASPRHSGLSARSSCSASAATTQTRISSSSSPTPKPQAQATKAAATTTSKATLPSTCESKTGESRETKSSSTVVRDDTSAIPVRRLAQLLHHDAARAQAMLRELRRRLVAAMKRRQQWQHQHRQRRQCAPSPARPRSPGITVRLAASADSSQVKAQRSPRSNASSVGDSEDRRDIVHKLEQACRYLKSELAAAQSKLSEAQAECQWRSLSMKKWEDDLQAARREVLSLEKERLSYTTEQETFELVRQELEAQLAESKKACVSAAEERATAQAAFEALKTAEEASRKSLEAEQAKTARLTAKVSELTEAQTALTDELDVLKDKHKTALSQLQTFRAQEAQQQQLKERQDSRLRTSEVAQLRAALAQLRVTESTWEAERSRLHSTIASLQSNVESCTEEADRRSRRCAALEAEAALNVDLETTTLVTIARIVQAPPPASVAACLAASVNSSGGVDASTPTEKRLFDCDEPSVEEVVVEEGAATAATAPRARVQKPQQFTPTPRQPPTGASNRSSSSSNNANTSGAKKRSPSSGTAHRAAARRFSSPLTTSVSTSAEASSVALAQLRQHVVTAVQQAALELSRLRAAAQPYSSSLRPLASSSPAPSQPTPPPSTRYFPAVRTTRTTTTAAAAAAETGECDVVAGAWFGREAGRCSVSHNAGGSSSNASHPSSPSPTSSPSQGQEMTWMDRRLSSAPQLQPYGPSTTVSPRRQHDLAPLLARSPTTEHVYNIAAGTPSHELWSPSARPPVAAVKETTAPKEWSEVRRSSSMEDGLSGYSNSATRGGVDGSGSPARPPSLRAPSLPH